MSILDFPMPLMPVIGCRVHHIATPDDVDPPLSKEELDRIAARRRYQRNREKILRSKSSPENRARAREALRKWRAANRQRVNEYERKYYAENRDRLQANRRTLRASKKGSK